MSKWADFLISEVKYSADQTHIEKVRIRVSITSPATEISRKEVVADIKNGKTYVTILMSKGTWTKGQDVHIITVENEDFIRTDKNKIAKDNLENLPQF